jgi:hypothetical protein
MSIPPKKPTVCVRLTIAASAPARNEASFDLNVTDVTLGASTTASMIEKWLAGKRSADSARSCASSYPMQKISS